MSLADFDEILEKISKPEFKGSLMHTTSVIIHKNGLKNRNYTNVFCKEYLMTIAMVAYLPKNSYLTEVINSKIGLLHNAGLIEIWDRQSGAKNELHKDSDDDNKKPINVKDLKGIFLFFLMGLGCSTLSILIEFLVKYLRKKSAKKKTVEVEHVQLFTFLR